VDRVLIFVAGSNGLKLKTNTAFRFTRHELMDWSHVDHCDVFISCLNSYSDGTHSQQRIHYKASDVNFYYLFI